MRDTDLGATCFCRCSAGPWPCVLFSGRLRACSPLCLLTGAPEPDSRRDAWDRAHGRGNSQAQPDDWGCGAGAGRDHRDDLHAGGCGRDCGGESGERGTGLGGLHGLTPNFSRTCVLHATRVHNRLWRPPTISSPATSRSSRQYRCDVLESRVGRSAGKESHAGMQGKAPKRALNAA